MKVCIYGAGAIGGHLAARLHRGGADVAVIARGPHLEAIRKDGLHLHTRDDTFIAPVRAASDPAAIGPQDMVIVAVKAPGLATVADGIVPLLGPDTAVVFMLNGIPWWYFHGHGGPEDGQALPRLDPGGALQRTIGMDRVIGGVVYSACTVTAPGVVHVENVNNRFVLGEPDGRLSARLDALAQPLRAGGLTIDISPRIRDVIWDKLLRNLGSGPLGVLTASTPSAFYAEPACIDATRAVVAEALAIAAAMGCPVVADADQQIASIRNSAHKTSILQDLELGRPMEIDALYTVPLDMARARGIATPTLGLLAALTRARARAAGLYTD